MIMSSTKKLKRKKENDDDDDYTKKRIKTSKEPSVSQNDKAEEVLPQWTETELLSELHNLDFSIAENITKLLEEGNTIPFIARYRRDATNNMDSDNLREIKETYEEICVLKNKIKTVSKTLEKAAVLTADLKRSITSARSIEELEFIYSPYKPGGKKTLAQRAKEAGLEDAALSLLNNTKHVDLSTLINKSNKDLASVADVEKGIVYIISHILSTDIEMLTFLRNLKSRANFQLVTKKTTHKQETKQKADNKKAVDESKFDNYYNFEIPVKYIKPHQVLAINRGENLKVLSVKIVVPDNVSHNYNNFCTRKWLSKGKTNQMREKIIRLAIDDSYTRFVQPLIVREIRSELKVKAERASCEVFSANLKNLLLLPPLKGKSILGIDPGFTNGCKLALINEIGQLLSTQIIYPHKRNHSNKDNDARTLKTLLIEHKCNVIALGNGTAVRETEQFITDLIQNNYFMPLNVSYIIVNEAGASIYSCSAEAKKEFGELDPNLISAVSLARRVQEPIAEFVKVEPKHLGIGMYQHDIKKKQLEESLNDVVSECVSFVGVDLNTASQCLLKHVAGLSEKKSQQIIQHRDKNGPFKARSELLEVYGIGKRVFEQCAGFLRVGPVNQSDSAFYTNPKYTKLDATIIHPETYEIALNVIKKLKLNVSNIGDKPFIDTVKSKIQEFDFQSLSSEFKTNIQTIQLIFDALSKPVNYDMRVESGQEPLFKKGLTNINSLKENTVLTGSINNVTHFGCFVDIGVGSNGLIHVSKYNGLVPKIGDKVEVKVVNLDVPKKRIGLEVVRKLIKH